FNENQKQVIDFDEIKWNTDELESKFSFNVILLYYKDKDNIDKLHGINFISNYENKVSYWDMPSYEVKNNIINNVGYQFIFNMKSVTNDSTISIVQENNELFYTLYGETLGKLNSFLESKLHE
ncbi:hypothetical protein EZS27_013078, partial [termite gut metagenome]